MSDLIYEFESVKDREGNDKRIKGKHTNPVHILRAMIGKRAMFAYVDVNDCLITSEVESMIIILNHITITTKNTEYTLKPYIREGV